MRDLLSRLGGRKKRATDAVATSDSSAAVSSTRETPQQPDPGSTADAGFQGEIDALPAGAVVTVHPPLERQGPLVLAKPITMRGGGVTVWSSGGPVVWIRASGVALHDVQIETIDENQPAAGAVALDVAPGCVATFQNVVVRGRVQGVPGEEGQWDYPHALAMGSLSAGASHVFRLRLVVPAPCRIRSRVEPVHVVPEALATGSNDLEIRVDGLPKDTLIHGDLVIESAHLLRAIRLTGHVAAQRPAAAATGQPRMLWEPTSAPPEIPSAAPAAPDPTGQALPAETPLTVAPVPPVAAPPAPAPASAVSATAPPGGEVLSSRSRGLRQVGNPISGVFAASPRPASPTDAPSAAPVGPEPTTDGSSVAAPAPTGQRRGKVTRQPASVPKLFEHGSGLKPPTAGARGGSIAGRDDET